MNQTLKISIARGGCRFATPLYLGGSYVLTFDGERSNEADSCVITKPRSTNPNDSTGIDGLAQTVRSGTTLTLALNKQVLLDWFKDNGACDIDGSVDAHCYVFNSAGDVIADSDISIEYRPIDFVIDITTFNNWEELRTRIVSLEAQATTANTRLNGHDTKVQELTAADAANLIVAANDATAKANAALANAKAYADAIMNMVAKLQYVKCDAESTEQKNIYHRVFVTKNAQDQHTLAIDETPVSIEGGDPETTRYVYTDTQQTISGAKTFTGATNVPTVASSTNDTNAASTAYVVSRIVADLATFLSTLKSGANTWTGVNTFSAGVVANVTGNVTGNLSGNVTGNVTGDVTAQNIDTATLDATGAETHTGTESHTGAETHTGNETHSGTESHTGAVTISNVVSPTVASDPVSIASTRGINAAYAWAMLGKYCVYFGGNYRILDTNPIAYALNGGTAHDSDINSSGWREHDRQGGLFSWLCTVMNEGCFEGNNSLGRIVFPNVTEVKTNAFKFGHELYTAVLPSCTKIANGAFHCPSADGRSAYELRAIYAPEVTEIGANAFAWNHALHCINEDENAIDHGTTALYGTVKFPKCVSVGDNAFYNAGIHYYSRPYYLLRYVDLPVCRYVGNYAFYDDTGYGCRPYKEVKIGNKQVDGQYVVPLGSVEGETDTRNYIGSYAFYDESDSGNGPLTKIDCPRTQVFKSYCFYNANHVTTDINIQSAEVIEDFAFAYLGCAYSNNSTFPQTGINIPNCKSVGQSGLANYISGSNNDYYTFRWINAPALETTGVTAFMRQCNLVKVNMPSLVTIGNDAFNRCYNLSKSYEGSTEKDYLEFPVCTTVGTSAFYNCSSIVTLKMNNAATIGAGAFYGCSAITNLYLENVTSDVILSQINNWNLSGNCRVHASGGSTIAYVNGVWQVI